jgi:Domain of unknown function (DUF4389)
MRVTTEAAAHEGGYAPCTMRSHMTQTYPVHFSVEHPPRFTRINLLVRVAAFVALGMLGLSFGAVFLFAYLLLPVVATIRLSGSGADDPGVYLRQDGPKILTGLRWFAALSAWAGLTSERFPTQDPVETVTLEVEATPHRTGARSSAIWRIFTGIPSALVLGILSWIGTFVWLWAALSILISERVGPGAHQFLVGLQRWTVRLLAYQASLVDEYPPFSFTDAAPALPVARATS